MSKNIECEERLMLSETKYNELLAYYKQSKEFVEKDIKNFYFDDNELSLTSKHIMVRIRISNNIRYSLTLKVKGDEGDLEVSQSLSKEDYEVAISKGIFPSGQVLETLSKYAKNITKLKFIADLHCFRTSFSFKEYLIEIDKNSYLNKNDFDVEVEAESMDIAKEKITEICNLLNVQYDSNYKVKSARVFDVVKHSYQQHAHK